MRHLRWKPALAMVVAGMLLSQAGSVSAQLMPIPDDTLGNESSTIRPINPDYPGDVIEGGLRAGDTLFHSFREFNVESGRAVYFADPGVDRILSRVSGEGESQILGLLGVFGDANLFLINPNGIIFGENARLDLRGGSLFATTADVVQFGVLQPDESEPSSPTKPLLTIRRDVFVFNQATPAAIVNNSRTSLPISLDGAFGGGLRVADGERITLLGGDVRLNGGGLSALGGRVEIGGLSGPGAVAVNADGSLEFSADAARSDVSITNGSRLSVSDSTIGGGSLAVTARALEIANSSISAGTLGESRFVEGRAGDITLDASSIQAVGATIDNVVRGSRGNGGDVLITADDLFVSGSVVQSTLLGEGSAGRVRIDARDRVTIAANSTILSNLGGADRNIIATGEGGNIEITTPILSLSESQLQSGTYGRGNAGNVIINAPQSVTVENGGILSDVFTNQAGNPATGNGGNIQITTPVLSLTNESILSSRTSARGNAGNVIVDASESATFERSRIISDVDLSFGDGAAVSPAVGDGGDIQITTPSLVLNNSVFSANTLGFGDAGNIRIMAGSLLAEESGFLANSLGQGDAGDIAIETQGRTIFDRSNIATFLFPFLDGLIFPDDTGNIRKAGNIQIATGLLDLINGSQLQSITFGRGNAGDVMIRARDRISIEGVDPDDLISPSSIFASAEADDQSQGGDVSLTADAVRLADNGFISTSTSSRLSGGSVTVDANTLELASGGQIATGTSGDGRAGDIDLNITGQTILAGTSAFEVDGGRSSFSGLFANTARNSAGGGGIVRLSTAELQVLDQARIEVDSQGSGTAGDVEIAAGTVRLDNGRLTAETAAVNGGNITLGNLGLLLLRNGSLISTTAGIDGAGGNGGNIIINADAIVAVPSENSDIRANAFSGSGGSVRIDSQGLFGIAAQAQDNPLTSNVTASSAQGIQGTVDVAAPETNPRNGLTELPVAFADASNQITQTCSGNRAGQDSRFVVTGRGGLPPSPIDALVGDVPLSDWAVLDELTETTQTTPKATTSSVLSDPALSTEEGIVEAQGWTRENGMVKLVAAAPASVAQTATSCR
jgi:filamentous hemagglutinin family protein